MAPRSNWKGYLKLSLVSVYIAIYPATSSSEKVRFNTLNRATGNRLKRQMVDSGPRRSASRGPHVVNLMEALRRSIETGGVFPPKL